MASSAVYQRWQDEGYTNYLKIADALLYVRDGVGAFCQGVISNFQSEIITKHKISQKRCTCKAKNIKNAKLNPECPTVCSLMLKDIADQHRSVRNAEWTNARIGEWSIDAWEIAKIYMGRGQKAHNGPTSCDSAGIFQLLSHCKRFENFVSVNDVAKMSNVRNGLMHRAKLSTDSAQVKNDLNLMIQFLKCLIPKLTTVKIDAEPLENSVKKLTELMNSDFESFLKSNNTSIADEEIRILSDIISDHQTRLSSIERRTDELEELKAVCSLLTTLQKNPDLMEKLEDGFQNLLSLTNLEERTLALEEKSQATNSEVAVIKEDISEIQKTLENIRVSTASKIQSNAVDYKGKLKNFLESKKLVVPPKYDAWQDHGSNAWMANVTIELNPEPKTFECLSPCGKIIQAQQSAAQRALEFLSSNPDVFATNPAAETTNTEKSKQVLEKLLLSFGFAKPSYNDCDQKFTGKVTNFVASVTVSVRGVIQKRFSDGSKKTADMEQAVAEEALRAVGENVSTNHKNELYRWCGKRHSKPEYHEVSPRESLKYILVVSSAFTESRSIELEGDWSKGKKEAQQSAAEKLLKVIEDCKLSEIWRSGAGDGVSGQTKSNKKNEKMEGGTSLKENIQNAEGAVVGKEKSESTEGGDGIETNQNFETTGGKDTNENSESAGEKEKNQNSEAVDVREKMQDTEGAVDGKEKNQNTKAVAGVEKNHDTEGNDGRKEEMITPAAVSCSQLDFFKSLSFQERLENLSKQLDVELPQFIIVEKDGRFKADVVTTYVFGTEEKSFKKSGDAESEAARIALLCLLGDDKVFEDPKKPFKSQLNEYCQKTKQEPPNYIKTERKDGNSCSFLPKVKVKFLASFLPSFETELEARVYSAKKVLQMLRQNEDYFMILGNECEKLGVERPKVSYESNPSPDKADLVRAMLDMTFIFASKIPYANKKEAEKKVAGLALKILYPLGDLSDADKYKNLLQEQTPSSKVSYDTVNSGNGQFTSKVKVTFKLVGDQWHREKEDAVEEMADSFLKKLSQNDH